jgi:hypothetical protein
MTLHMPMTMNARRPTPTQEPRERVDSFAETPTGLLILSAEFLDALRQVAPKVRSRRLPYGLVLAAVAAIAVASVRQGLWHHIVSPRIHTAASSVASAAPVSMTADAAVRAPSAPPASTPTTIASGNAAPAPTPVSVDDWEPPQKPKTSKPRHAQMPH